MLYDRDVPSIMSIICLELSSSFYVWCAYRFHQFSSSSYFIEMTSFEFKVPASGKENNQANQNGERGYGRSSHYPSHPRRGRSPTRHARSKTSHAANPINHVQKQEKSVVSSVVIPTHSQFYRSELKRIGFAWFSGQINVRLDGVKLRVKLRHLYLPLPYKTCQYRRAYKIKDVLLRVVTDLEIKEMSRESQEICQTTVKVREKTVTNHIKSLV